MEQITTHSFSIRDGQVRIELNEAQFVCDGPHALGLLSGLEAVLTMVKQGATTYPVSPFNEP